MEQKVSKAYKFRIYPTKKQEILFDNHFGCTRFIYNHLLAERSRLWKEEGISITGFDAKRMIPLLKKSKEFNWLKEVNSQSLQEAALDLEKGFKRFFKKIGGASHPKLKKKGVRKSFCIPQNFSVDSTNNFIRIPKCKTPIKTKFHRSLKDVTKLNSLTISMSFCRKYYVSINVYEKIEIKKKRVEKVTKKTKAVGIDLGLKYFLVESNGRKIDNPRHFQLSEKRLMRERQRLFKKAEGSKNRKNQSLRVAKLHEKIRHQRLDFLHKETSRLTRENQVIYLEDLDIKRMIKDRRFSKAIVNVGWGEYIRQLKYKAQWTGVIVVQIGRFVPSSKLCSTNGCSYKNQDLKPSDREWTCPKCNTTHDRDINAAKNIEKIGRAAAELKPVKKSVNVFSIKKIQAASVK